MFSEQPSHPFFTRTDKMNGEATYVCQTNHAGVPSGDLDLRLQVIDTDAYGKKRLIEDIPTTLLEGNSVVRGTFRIKPKHATAIVQCVAGHTANDLAGAVEIEPAQDFFKKLTPLGESQFALPPKYLMSGVYLLYKHGSLDQNSSLSSKEKPKIWESLKYQIVHSNLFFNRKSDFLPEMSCLLICK